MTAYSKKFANRLRALTTLAPLAMLIGGCSNFFTAGSVRMLVNVTVVENGIERTGSGIWKTTVTNNIGIPDVPAYGEAEGDAIPVMLSNGKVFLLLLETRGNTVSLFNMPFYSPNISNIPMGLSYNDNPSLRDNAALSNDPARRNGEIGKQLGKVRYPSCDVADASKTEDRIIKPDDPEQICFRTAIAEGRKSLEQIHVLAPECPYIGPNCSVHIKSISITITDADTTRQLSAIFPWMEKYFKDDGKVRGNGLRLAHPALKILRT